MNKLFRVLTVAFTLIFTPFHANAQADTVTLLHVNDTHSMLAPTGPRTISLQGTSGGIARAATVIEDTRRSDRIVLLLHAGDFSMGDLFYNRYFGAAELKIMTRLGYDAMAVGNHEFDLTPSTLRQALDSGFVDGGFPLLSANLSLDAPAVASLRSYIRPYVVKEFGNVKVGIFGLLTPETNILSRPSPAFVDTGIISIARGLVDTLKSRRCNVIVCLSHLGIVDDERLASAVSGIDVIVGGHDHQRYAEPRTVARGENDTTWILQANSAYMDIGKLKLVIGGGHVRVLEYHLIPLDVKVSEEPGVASVVQGLVSQIEAVYGPMYTRQIGISTGFFKEVADSLMSPGYKDTPIGNLVTDAFKRLTGTQIAMEVGGSTAQPLYPGPIVTADAFRVVGYGFNSDNGLGYHLATFSLLGADLLKGLEFGLSSIEGRDEFLVQISGLTYSYKSSNPPFSRLVGVRVGESPVDPKARYSVTSNEFVPAFLGSIGIPFENLHLFGGDTTEAQVFADYISKIDSIRPKVEGRVVNVVGAEAEPQPQPESFPLLDDLGQVRPPQSSERSLEILPILSYDTDTGFGYGAKLFLLGQLGLSESFDVIFFNSTKGERWYKLVVSVPDFELRQGKPYPLAADLSIDYDKWIANGFYGIGNMSRYEDREIYTREPFEATLTLSKGFASTTVGQAGVKFKEVMVSNFGEGSRLAALPPGLYVPKASAASVFAVFRYDTRNSFINPTAGVVLQGELEHAPAFHMNDVSFSRIGGWFQSYQPLPDSKIIFALRLGLQSIFGNSIPVQFLLPLGGNTTLRGSPQDRYLDKVAALGNLEFRFPVFWRFGGIAGIDAGKVWNDLSKVDLIRWATNPTLGLRFFMDTFTVRLDVGFGKETTGFYLNFGQIF